MTETKDLIISIGTNVDQSINMFMGKQRLEELFHHVLYSSEIWSEPIELIESKPFLNCLAKVRTIHGLKQIRQALKQIERKCGVSQAMKHAGTVKLDLDILLYGDERFHTNDWERPYIKELLKELKIE